jgi:hypothetical protein
MKMSAVQKTQNSELMFEAYSAACDWFGLTKKEQAKILGVGRNTLHRNKSGFAETTKEFEIQVMFVLVYRSLYLLLGGNQQAMQEWFDDHNIHLGAIPRDLCMQIKGIVHLNDYLDAMRGKA